MSEAKAALFDYLTSRVQPYEAGEFALDHLTDENIHAVALTVLRARERGGQKIQLYEGWTFLMPDGWETDNKPMNAEARLGQLTLQAEIAIDNRGRVRKNKHGARGAEPVENPAPAVGVRFDPLKPNATLLDRLMLQHAASYRFGGITEGVGFFVTTTIEFGSEGWAFIRHYEDPYWSATKEVILQPCILAENETTGEQTWLPLDMAGVPGFAVVDMEEEHEAVTLALDLCDGRKKPAELDPIPSEKRTTTIRVTGGYGDDGPLEQTVEIINGPED